jgi:hypothetical protein
MSDERKFRSLAWLYTLLAPVYDLVWCASNGPASKRPTDPQEAVGHVERPLVAAVIDVPDAPVLRLMFPLSPPCRA